MTLGGWWRNPLARPQARTCSPDTTKQQTVIVPRMTGETFLPFKADGREVKRAREGNHSITPEMHVGNRPLTREGTDGPALVGA